MDLGLVNEKTAGIEVVQAVGVVCPLKERPVNKKTPLPQRSQRSLCYPRATPDEQSPDTRTVDCQSTEKYAEADADFLYCIQTNQTHHGTNTITDNYSERRNTNGHRLLTALHSRRWRHSQSDLYVLVPGSSCLSG